MSMHLNTMHLCPACQSTKSIFHVVKSENWQNNTFSGWKNIRRCHRHHHFFIPLLLHRHHQHLLRNRNRCHSLIHFRRPWKPSQRGFCAKWRLEQNDQYDLRQTGRRIVQTTGGPPSTSLFPPSCPDVSRSDISATEVLIPRNASSYNNAIAVTYGETF